MRRLFNEPERKPPWVRREEAETLTQKLLTPDMDTKILAGAAPGLGITRFLEHIHETLNPGMETASVVPIVTVADLGNITQTLPVQILVQIRNSFLKQIDDVKTLSGAAAYFIPFDVIARIAWLRDRPDAGDLQPAFYQTKAKKLGSAAVKLGRAFILAEAFEAGKDVIETTQVGDLALKQLTNKAVDKFSEAIAEGALDSDLARRLIDVLRRDKNSKPEDLDEFLVILLADAITYIIALDSKYRMVCLIDGADACDYDAPLLSGVRARKTLAGFIRAIEQEAGVVVGGQLRPGEDLLPQLTNLFDDLEEKIILEPLFRNQTGSTLRVDSELSDDDCERILTAVSNDDASALIHPTAMAHAFRLVPDSDTECSEIEIMRQSLWQSCPGPFTRAEIDTACRQKVSSGDAQRLTDKLFENGLWVRRAQGDRYKPTWFMQAAADLSKAPDGGRDAAD